MTRYHHHWFIQLFFPEYHRFGLSIYFHHSHRVDEMSLLFPPTKNISPKKWGYITPLLDWGDAVVRNLGDQIKLYQSTCIPIDLSNNPSNKASQAIRMDDYSPISTYIKTEKCLYYSRSNSFHHPSPFPQTHNLPIHIHLHLRFPSHPHQYILTHPMTHFHLHPHPPPKSMLSPYHSLQYHQPPTTSVTSQLSFTSPSHITLSNPSHPQLQ